MIQYRSKIWDGESRSKTDTAFCRRSMVEFKLHLDEKGRKNAFVCHTMVQFEPRIPLVKEITCVNEKTSSASDAKIYSYNVLHQRNR
mmetsp:Transcript_7669/g.14208  ORF Transcript_7669/g.14208 Transcript_7669/m.14208 type:complete len:87 (-) Transcript_7669:773-1033(-)